MNRKTKGILIITPAFRPNIGGVESYLDDLCDYLVKREHRVYVIAYQPITTKAKGLNFEKDRTLEIIRMPWFGHNLFHKLEKYPFLEFLYLTPMLFLSSLIFLTLNGRKIDCLHAQGLVSGFISIILARLFNKRAVMSTCAVYNFKKNSLFARISSLIISSFDKVLPLADFSKQELINIGVPKDKITTYNLWVRLNLYKPLDKKEAKIKIGLEDKFIVLYVGRFIEKKGVGLILDLIKDADKRICFLFIGDDGPLFGLVEDTSKEFDNVKLVKGIRWKELIPYYQAANVLLVPSLYDEAFGKVIIEALSCATPVIGAKKGAIPYIVNETVVA